MGKIFFIIFILIFITNMGNAAIDVPGQIYIELVNETIFNFDWFQDFSSLVSGSDSNWTFAISEAHKNVVFFDNQGELPIYEIKNENGLDFYKVGVRFGLPNIEKGINISSRNSDLFLVSENLSQLSIDTLSIQRRGAINENFKVKITYPASLQLLGENMWAFDANNSNSTYTATYLNPQGFLHFTFINKGTEKFVEKEIDNKTFYIQNDEALLEAFDEALIYKNLIWNYPIDKKDKIFITFSNLTRLDPNLLGFYTTDNLITINKDRALKKDEIVTVLLHELTHYSDYSLYENNNFWQGLDEGFAVYTELKYLDEKYKDYNGYIPNSSWLFPRKPSREDLELWYTNANQEVPYSLIAFMNNVNWTIINSYPLAGFIINYYRMNEGDETFKRGIERGIKLRQIAERDFSGVNYASIQALYLRGLIEVSDLKNREELLFPQLQLYREDKEKYFELMRPLISDIPNTEAIEIYNLGKIEEKVENPEDIEKRDTKLITIFSLFVGIMLFLLLLKMILGWFKKG
jgi:hypothetical protein